MKVTKRDWLFVAVVAVVLGVLLLNGGKEKPKRVPVDDRHRPLLERLAKGAGREEVERACAVCHNARGIPLPAHHPPKEQCLLCHAR
jgi:mono/diheme cytochrome c family protein